MLLTLTLLKFIKIYVKLACVKTLRTRSLRATVKLIANNISKIQHNHYFYNKYKIKNYLIFFSIK